MSQEISAKTAKTPSSYLKVHPLLTSKSSCSMRKKSIKSLPACRSRCISSSSRKFKDRRTNLIVKWECLSLQKKRLN